MQLSPEDMLAFRALHGYDRMFFLRQKGWPRPVEHPDGTITFQSPSGRVHTMTRVPGRIEGRCDCPSTRRCHAQWRMLYELCFGSFDRPAETQKRSEVA